MLKSWNFTSGPKVSKLKTTLHSPNEPPKRVWLHPIRVNQLRNQDGVNVPKTKTIPHFETFMRKTMGLRITLWALVHVGPFKTISKTVIDAVLWRSVARSTPAAATLTTGPPPPSRTTWLLFANEKSKWTWTLHNEHSWTGFGPVMRGDSRGLVKQSENQHKLYLSTISFCCI